MNTPVEPRAAQPRAVAAQWVAVVGPPIVWLTQFEARYALAGRVGAAARVAMFVTAGLSLVAIAICALTAWRQSRLAEASPLDQTAGVGGRTRFMGALGLSASGLFFLVIVAQLLADFFIPPGKL
jgi:hypothetical protein